MSDEIWAKSAFVLALWATVDRYRDAMPKFDLGTIDWFAAILMANLAAIPSIIVALFIAYLFRRAK